MFKITKNILINNSYIIRKFNQRKNKKAPIVQTIPNYIDRFIHSIDFNNNSNCFLKEDIENYIRRINNFKTEIQVLPIKKSETGGLFAGTESYILDKNNKLEYLTIELPFKRSKFDKKNFPLVVHELTHAFYDLILKKSIHRSVKTDIGMQKINKKNGVTPLAAKYDNIYNHLYNNETINSREEISTIISKHKRKIKQLIAGLPAELKLDIIQNMRYSLQSEYFAYQAESHAADYMKARNIELNDEYKNFYYDDFLFEQKLEMLKELGFEIIKKERTKFKKSIKNHIQ